MKERRRGKHRKAMSLREVQCERFIHCGAVGMTNGAKHRLYNEVYFFTGEWRGGVIVW